MSKKDLQNVSIDSYDTIGQLWQDAYYLIGDHDKIKIVMDNQGYEIINLENNEIVLRGEIIWQAISNQEAL